MSQWDRCSEVLSLWISHYKGTGEKKRVRRSLYNAVLQAGFPKVAVSLKVSLRLMHIGQAWNCSFMCMSTRLLA